MIETVNSINPKIQDNVKSNVSIIGTEIEIFSPRTDNCMTDVFTNQAQDEPDIPPQKDPNSVPPKDIKLKPQKPKPILGKKFSDEFSMQYPEKANTTEVDKNKGYTITYDENGKISKLESPDGKFVREIEEKTFTDRTINSEENYFDEQVYKKNNRKLITNRRYYTDNEGKITKRIDFFKDGTACDFNQFIYDENGMLIKKEGYNYISEMKTYRELEHYSDRDYITLFTPLDLNTKNYITNETTYTTDGLNIIEETNYESDKITDQDYCKFGAKEKIKSKFYMKFINFLSKLL